MRIIDKGTKSSEPTCRPRNLCVEQVWPIDMDAHPIFVHTIIDVSADVIPLINHMDAVSCLRQRACIDRTSEACTNDEYLSFDLILL